MVNLFFLLFVLAKDLRLMTSFLYSLSVFQTRVYYSKRRDILKVNVGVMRIVC